MHSRQVMGAGVALAVSEWGDPSRPTVVLVHGYPDTSAVWRPVAAELVARSHHVVAYDVRGAGRSEAPSSTAGYRLSLLVEDLRAVVDAVSPDAPVHLVGHDWGSIQSWEAVTSPLLEGRLASYTSISGPPLDHVGHLLRRTLRRGAVHELVAQAVVSSYIAGMHLPGVPRLAARLAPLIGRRRGRWASVLQRMDGAEADADWPAATFGADVARGMRLYRANIVRRLARPGARRTDIPVQLVVPTRDRFVPGRLFRDLESCAPRLRRREVDAGHWVLRADPAAVAGWIAEFVGEVESTSAVVAR